MAGMNSIGTVWRKGGVGLPLLDYGIGEAMKCTIIFLDNEYKSQGTNRNCLIVGNFKAVFGFYCAGDAPMYGLEAHFSKKIVWNFLPQSSHIRVRLVNPFTLR
jgi:hypothetical protein